MDTRELGAGATEGTRVSNALGVLALQFWGFQGKQLLWECLQGTQVMLEISTHSQHHPPRGSPSAVKGTQGCCGDITWGLGTLLHGKPGAPEETPG